MKRLLAVVVVLALGSLQVAEAKKAPTAHHEVHPGVLYLALSPTRWRVGFTGSGAFDRSMIERTVLRTAAKLTLAQGFDWFQPIGERVEPVETADAVDMKRPPSGAPPQDMYLKWGEVCSAVWVFGPDPSKLCGSVPPDGPFQTSTQVVLGHGPAPVNGIALDARTVERQTHGMEPEVTKAHGSWLPKVSMPRVWPF